MSKYRISVSIDEENFFWIVVDTWVNPAIVIWNPTEEDLKDTILSKSYTKTNVCSICREENNITSKSILYPGNVYHETDKTGKKTKEWLCRRHGYNRYQRYDNNSGNNIIKSLAHRRTGNLKNPRSIFADNCEELTVRWRGIKSLNVENDNYNSPLDHTRDPELGIVQTKGTRLTKMIDDRYNILEYDCWSTMFINEQKKEFDYIILYCASADGKTIERIYIFPKYEIIKRSGIKILKDSSGLTWHYPYAVKDKDILKIVNEIWKDIIS